MRGADELVLSRVLDALLVKLFGTSSTELLLIPLSAVDKLLTVKSKTKKVYFSCSATVSNLGTIVRKSKVRFLITSVIAADMLVLYVLLCSTSQTFSCKGTGMCNGGGCTKPHDLVP